MRILCVDDDPLILDILEMILSEEGHEVVRANDATEALGLLRDGQVRMVLSDWMMPGMDGLELCRRIRAELRTSYIYVILLTSRSKTEDMVAGLGAGADDLIPKPVNADELIVRIKVGQRILSLESSQVTIFALAKLAESRDPETGLHLERMREYSRVLATYLASHPPYRDLLPYDYAEMIYLTSPLHDIGKVGIPDHVLLKPGRLTDREFQIMKNHTVIGGNTLGAALAQYPSLEYLHIARDVALYHHERVDGSGYPEGLKGNDIPLCARIVALADVYDALTSKRVYKAAFAHEVARSIILKDSGSHFDTQIVDAFSACEEQFIEIRQRYSDPDAESPTG